MVPIAACRLLGSCFPEERLTTSSEVPQADRLDFVRRLVAAIHTGATSIGTAAVRARLAPRYANYAAQAARQLGLLESGADGRLMVSTDGARLLATPEGSSEERRLLSDAFTKSSTLSKLSEVVLGELPPSRAVLSDMIADGWGLSTSTALRRATTLLSWRAYLLQEGEQLPVSGAYLGGTDRDEEGGGKSGAGPS